VTNPSPSSARRMAPEACMTEILPLRAVVSQVAREMPIHKN
jgi:hypothetical protein